MNDADNNLEKKIVKDLYLPGLGERVNGKFEGSEVQVKVYPPGSDSSKPGAQKAVTINGRMVIPIGEKVGYINGTASRIEIGDYVRIYDRPEPSAKS